MRLDAGDIEELTLVAAKAMVDAAAIGKSLVEIELDPRKRYQLGGVEGAGKMLVVIAGGGSVGTLKAAIKDYFLQASGSRHNQPSRGSRGRALYLAQKKNKPMSSSSSPDDKIELLRMVVGESFHYLILHIWDGRFAAFYKTGFEIDHCTAVANHQIDDDGWPFAFIGDSRETVLQWAIEADRDDD
jgi:hypothetical protein